MPAGPFGPGLQLQGGLLTLPRSHKNRNIYHNILMFSYIGIVGYNSRKVALASLNLSEALMTGIRICIFSHPLEEFSNIWQRLGFNDSYRVQNEASD